MHYVYYLEIALTLDGHTGTEFVICMHFIMVAITILVYSPHACLFNHSGHLL